MAQKLKFPKTCRERLRRLISIDGAKFILVSIDTKKSMKQRELAEKWLFFKGYSKWAILAKMQRGDPMQNSTIIANTSRIAKFCNHN